MKKTGSGTMRTAIDTNILVRILARDRTRQWEIANPLLDDHQLLVRTTVVIETEWVLRGIMKYPRNVVFDLLSARMVIPNIKFEEPERVECALGLFRAGMDFADALHMSALHEDDRFLTFDREFVKRAFDNKQNISVELAH